jgi:hypothetical protein
MEARPGDGYPAIPSGVEHEGATWVAQDWTEEMGWQRRT